MKVAVTGATGFVGEALVVQLLARGDQVVVFTRQPEVAQQRFPQTQVVAYTPTTAGQWQEAVAGCDAVVNLAGEPIADRWTPEKRQAILDSRQQGTLRLVEAIAQAQPRPAVLINASAIGYYGDSETARFTETSPPGTDFLSQVCQAWEAAAQPVTASGCRLVIFRIGIVLAMGGALAKILPPFWGFLGGPIGSGRQWFSWIQRDDLVALILAALDNPAWSGVYNATAPQPVRMAEFCRILGEVIGRPSWLPVPAFVLELLLGDGAQVVLTGQQVIPERALAMGFSYRYGDVQAALQSFL